MTEIQATPDEVRAPCECSGRHLSTANLRLYERLGYIEECREQLKPGVVPVYLTKQLAAATD